VRSTALPLLYLMDPKQAEVVDRYFDPELAQLVDNGLDLVKVLDDARLGDLDHERVGRQTFGSEQC
jgi:hypothetical protein